MSFCIRYMPEAHEEFSDGEPMYLSFRREIGRCLSPDKKDRMLFDTKEEARAAMRQWGTFPNHFIQIIRLKKPGVLS